MSTTAVYLRVSSKSQKVESQRHAIESYLHGHGITDPKWYEDTISTRKDMTERQGLTELQAAIFTGQVKTVILYRLDRLARSIRDGINLLTDWIKAGVRIVIVTMQIDLSGALGQTVAALLLGLAQMERETTRERQAAGIEAARARNGGVCCWGGRKKGTTTVDYARAEELHRKGLSVAEIASALGCSKSALYGALRERGLVRNYRPRAN